MRRSNEEPAIRQKACIIPAQGNAALGSPAEIMNANASRLSGLTKELSRNWQQTREHWQDAKSLEFEHKYLEELVASVEKTVTVIEQLDKLITRIRKDCE